MKTLRVYDQTGSKCDYETEFVPRIGERVQLEYKLGKEEPLKLHFFRVKDVMYRLDKPADIQVAILIEEEINGEEWPI
jgi:hypothetical protein